MFNFLEQPWTLLVISAIVFLFMFKFAGKNPAKSRWQPMALPVLLAVIGVGLDFFVKTDTEKISTVVATAVQASETEDCRMLEGIISADYRDSFHSSKMRLLSHCRARFAEPLIEKCITRIISLEKQPQRAILVLTARVVFDKRSFMSQYRPLTLVKLKVELGKQPDKNWLISRAEIVEIDGQPAGWKIISNIN